MTESGRSMVEMLGVLAIMGILSVGGIAMYNSAMVKHRANTLMTEAQKRAVVASAQIIMQGKQPNLAEFEPYNATEIGRFGEATKEGLSNQFGIKINYVEKSVCQALLNMIGDQTPIRRLSYPASPATPISECDEVGNYLIVYNDDLSPKDQTEPVSEENQPQECEEDTDCQTVCGTCQVEAGSIKGVCENECEIPAGSCDDNDDCNAENECMICDPATRTCKDGCKKVEYLESTGTQWLNTGYNPNSNTKVEARFKMNETTDTYKWLFLSRNENVAGDGYGFGSVANGYIDSEFNNRTTSTTDKLTNGVIYDVVKDKNVCQYNDKTLTNQNSTFTVNYPLTIFVLNNGSAGIAQSTYTKANCYYFKIWDNSTLVRDMIPVLDWDMTPCMYDKVEKKLYYNAGSGTFKTNLNP